MMPEAKHCGAQSAVLEVLVSHIFDGRALK